MTSAEQAYDATQRAYNADPSRYKIVGVFGKENTALVSPGYTYTSDGTTYKVVSVDRPSTSQPFAAITVAPQKTDGSYDYKNLTVAAAGTNPQHVNDLAGAAQSFSGNSSVEYNEADLYVSKVEKHKGWHVSNLAGYSQSAYMVKVGAKKHIPTVIFNGWISTESLSDKETDYIKKHPEMFTIYHHTNDSVVKWLNGNTVEKLRTKLKII